MELEHETWVVVADGEKYLLLRNEGDAEYPNLRVVSEADAEIPPDRELGTDKAGRMPDAGPGRSALEETDWHRLEETRFARDLADRLGEMARQGRFRRLVVAAEPKTLGALRAAYGTELVARVAAEIDKDLTNAPVDEIERILKAS